MKLVLTLAAFLTFGLAVGQTPDLKSTLQTALDDERHAHALYGAVMLKYGEVRPFANIVRSEAMHMKLATDLMAKYSFKPAPDKFARKPRETKEEFIARLEVPATYAAALRMAASLERQQGPLYGRLSEGVPDDVKTVFTKLKADSVERHLVAFERSLTRVPGRGPRYQGNRPPN